MTLICVYDDDDYMVENIANIFQKGDFQELKIYFFKNLIYLDRDTGRG